MSRILRFMVGKTVQDRFIDYGFTSNRIQGRESELPFRKSQAFKFHRHNEIELIYVEQGDIEMIIGSREDNFTTGDFGVFWGALPHKMFRTEGTVEYWLTLPLAWFLQWDLGKDLTESLLWGEVIKESTCESQGDRLQFQRWDQDIKRDSPEHRTIVLLEVEVRLRRLVLALNSKFKEPSTKTPAKRPPNRMGQGKMDRIIRYIVDHYTETLTIETIARSVGLHPDYAVSRFKKICGVGMVDYWNQLRVSHAQRLLSTTDMKVIDIAMDSGFGSASRFYTVFKQWVGQSPRQYRNAVQGAS